jgi:hypothetical protein
MTEPSHSRADRARRLARALGVEFHTDLVELVPPAPWDEYPTRADLTEAVRAQDVALHRRLRAVRDALAAAQQDEARRRLLRAAAMSAGLIVTVALVGARRRRSSVTRRAHDHGGSCAGQRQALHRRRVG